MVDTQSSSAAFFDIGNALGSTRPSSQPSHRFEGLDVYQKVPEVLKGLSDSGVRLGIISDVSQETEEDVRRVLEEADLYDFFKPNLLINGRKDSPEIFRRAAEQAGLSLTPERCLYVSENRDERGYALEAGFGGASHPRALGIMDLGQGGGSGSSTESEERPRLSKLTRRSGLLTILSGLVVIVVTILDLFTIGFNDLRDAATTSAFAFYHGLSLLAAVLLLVGLVGLYAHQDKKAGALGLVGFLAAFAGTALVVGVFWAQTFGSPAIATMAVAEVAPRVLEDPPPWLQNGYVWSILSFALGWVLFGVATVRAGVFSSNSAALLIIGAALSLTPVPFTEPVFAAAIVWMGFGLFRGGRGS